MVPLVFVPVNVRANGSAALAFAKPGVGIATPRIRATVRSTYRIGYVPPSRNQPIVGMDRS